MAAGANARALVCVSFEKDRGNVKFNAGDVQRAARRYTSALEFLTDDEPEVKALRAVVLSNRAACALKVARWPAGRPDPTRPDPTRRPSL